MKIQSSILILLSHYFFGEAKSDSREPDIFKRAIGGGCPATSKVYKYFDPGADETTVDFVKHLLVYESAAPVTGVTLHFRLYNEEDEIWGNYQLPAVFLEEQVFWVPKKFEKIDKIEIYFTAAPNCAIVGYAMGKTEISDSVSYYFETQGEYLKMGSSAVWPSGRVVSSSLQKTVACAPKSTTADSDFYFQANIEQDKTGTETTTSLVVTLYDDQGEMFRIELEAKQESNKNGAKIFAFEFNVPPTLSSVITRMALAPRLLAMGDSSVVVNNPSLYDRRSPTDKCRSQTFTITSNPITVETPVTLTVNLVATS